MPSKKFIDLHVDEQITHVHKHFVYRAEKGWLNNDGEFCGQSEQDVIRALIDLEYAEINSIGDCMTGYCVTSPKITDFVKK